MLVGDRREAGARDAYIAHHSAPDHVIRTMWARMNFDTITGEFNFIEANGISRVVPSGSNFLNTLKASNSAVIGHTKS